MMARLLFVILVGLALAANPPSTAAQPASDCAGLTAEAAQAELDVDPTYATRDRLDADGDGIACNDDPCAALTAEAAQAELDVDPTYATRDRLDADGDGIACNDDVPNRPAEVPATGIGTMAFAPQSTDGVVSFLVVAAVLCASIALALRRGSSAPRAT